MNEWEMRAQEYERRRQRPWVDVAERVVDCVSIISKFQYREIVGSRERWIAGTKVHVEASIRIEANWRVMFADNGSWMLCISAATGRNNGGAAHPHSVCVCVRVCKCVYMLPSQPMSRCCLGRVYARAPPLSLCMRACNCMLVYEWLKQ